MSESICVSSVYMRPQRNVQREDDEVAPMECPVDFHEDFLVRGRSAAPTESYQLSKCWGSVGATSHTCTLDQVATSNGQLIGACAM